MGRIMDTAAHSKLVDEVAPSAGSPTISSTPPSPPRDGNDAPDSSDDDDDDECFCPPTNKGKGKAKADSEPVSPQNECHLIALPLELIDSILLYLSAFDLVSVSETCHALYTLATSDHLWQALVQENVPGVRVDSPYPLPTFRHLYRAHDPHWFVPRHKIWFSDADLTGRVILTRYDPRRGCIEGYQLLAVNNRNTQDAWEADERVTISSFQPKVSLHLDKAILRLTPNVPEIQEKEKEDSGYVKVMRLLPRRKRGQDEGEDEGEEHPKPIAGPSIDTTESSSEHSEYEDTALTRTRFQNETPMVTGSVNSMHSNFLLARPAPPSAYVPRHEDFPYHGLWPPPTIPADHRVVGIDHYSLDDILRNDEHLPRRRRDISEHGFRIRKWLEMRLVPNTAAVAQGPGHPLFGGGGVGGFANAVAHYVAMFQGLGDDLVNNPPHSALHIGEELATYATLDPELYTPTEEKPWRGIWVGDYSAHGCEFLLVHQPDDEPGTPRGDENLVRQEGESEKEFAERKKEARIFHGRLEAVKLTGDPHVPRGEISFVVDDLSNDGETTVMKEAPFQGVRAVKSRGHIANEGFMDDEFIDSQLLLTGHNRLAQYWVGFRHISFFERVDIESFLKP